MGKKEEILNRRDDHRKEYEAFLAEQQSIKERINVLSNDIQNVIANINVNKNGMRESIKVIYTFLKQFGTPDRKIPEITDFCDETAPVKKEFDAITTCVDALQPPRFGSEGKTQINEIRSFEQEKSEWEQSIELCKNERKRIDEYLQIARIYKTVISTVRQTVEDVIIREIPGIEAYLYARGVKDAIAADRLPSQSKPVPIDRLKNSPSATVKSNYLFFQNTVDFYTLMSGLYRNDYLSRFWKEQANFHQTKDAIDNQLEHVCEQEAQLKNHRVYSRESE